MCLFHVYKDEGDGARQLMDRVCQLEITEDGICCTDLFGRKQVISGYIRSVDSNQARIDIQSRK